MARIQTVNALFSVPHFQSAAEDSIREMARSIGDRFCKEYGMDNRWQEKASDTAQTYAYHDLCRLLMHFYINHFSDEEVMQLHEIYQCAVVQKLDIKVQSPLLESSFDTWLQESEDAIFTYIDALLCEKQS